MAPVWEANHVWLIFVLTVRLDGLPGRVRLDRLDARDPALRRRRSGSSCAAAPTRCARARGSAREQRAGRDRALALVDPDAVRARAPRSAGSRRAASRSATPPATSSRAGSTRPRSRSASSPSRSAAYTGGRLPGGRRGARTASPSWRSAFRTRALSAGVAAGASPLAGLIVRCTPTRTRLFHGLIHGAGAARADRLGRRGRGRDAGLVRRRRYEPARYTAALAVAAMIAGWALGQAPSSCPGSRSSRRRPRATRSSR